MHDVFQPYHLRKLPRTLKTCANSILKGNLEFATIATLSRLTILYYRSIDPLLLQPVYYIILDPSHLRNVDWENLQAVSAIRRRVAAIISTLRVVLDPMGMSKLPAQAASEIWDRIWKWAQFIEEYNEVLSLDTLEIWVSAGEKVAGRPITPLLRYYSALSECIHIYRKAPVYLAASEAFIHNNPGIFRVVAQGWKTMLPAEAHEQQSGAEKDYNEISYGIHGASLFLFNNCQDLLRDDGPHLQAILDGVGGWEHLAELFVRHTHQSIPGSGVTATAWHSERVACPLIFLKSGRRRPALFFEALGRWGMIAALTKAALRLPGMRDDKVARQADITRYLSLLIENHPRSDLRLIEGLRAGLIEAMSQAAPVARETVRSFLVKVIIQHCVYRSVVHALQHALRHPSIKTRTDLFEDLGLSREWKQCKNTILASALSVKEYEEGNANWTPGRACDNTDCRSPSSDVRLRRCGGCHYTRYCSRSCQKADWHFTHRSECRFVRYQLQRNCALFTPGDRGFFDARVVRAFRDQKSNELVWRSSLKQPGSSFTVDTRVMEREAKDGNEVERYTPWADTERLTPAARPYAELLVRRGVRLGSARAQIGCLGFVQGTVFRKHYVLVRIPEVVESGDEEASGSKSSGVEDETEDAEEDV